MKVSGLVMAAGVASLAASLVQGSPLASTALVSLVALTSIASAAQGSSLTASSQGQMSAWAAYDQALDAVNEACEKYNTMKGEFVRIVLAAYKRDCQLDTGTGKPKDENACETAKSEFTRYNQEIEAPYADCTGCTVLLVEDKCPSGKEKAGSLRHKLDEALEAARQEDSQANNRTVADFNAALNAL